MAFNVITPARLGQVIITVAPVVVHTASTDTKTLVKQLDICNTTSAVVKVSVFLVPSGSSASVSNAIFYAVSVPANGVVQWSGIQVLDAGGSIWASADVLGCTITASGGVAQ